MGTKAKISFAFQMMYSITLVICAGVMYNKVLLVMSVGTGYTLNPKDAFHIAYQLKLFFQDYQIFCHIAYFYLAYVVLTFLLFDMCQLHNSCVCAGPGSLNSTCRADNPAIVFFGRLILNFVLVCYTLIVFIEVAKVYDRQDEGTDEFKSGIFAPMLASLLVSFVILPLDYYFGFTALNNE